LNAGCGRTVGPDEGGSHCEGLAAVSSPAYR
jgi:hypothetical protein